MSLSHRWIYSTLIAPEKVRKIFAIVLALTGLSLIIY